jgi:fructose-specific phosphotransferase system IIC component
MLHGLGILALGIVVFMLSLGAAFFIGWIVIGWFGGIILDYLNKRILP